MPEVCKKCIDASVNDCDECEKDEFIKTVADTADVYDEKEGDVK